MRPILRLGSMIALGLILQAAALSLASANQGHQIKVFLLNMGVQTPATGNVLFVSNQSQNLLKISVSKMTPGTYDVALDGAIVDSLKVNSKGKATLRHKSVLNPKKGPVVPLPYDPRGGQISIESHGTPLLEGEIPETPEENEAHVEIESDLTNLGVVSGEAEAEFETSSGRMQFEVELEDAPTGAYDLLVDGVNVGTIHVGIDGEGKIEFDSMPSVNDDDQGDDDEQGDDDDQGELDLLLTFDPRGKTIAIEQNGTALFSSVFPLQGTTGDDGDDDDDDEGDD